MQLGEPLPSGEASGARRWFTGRRRAARQRRHRKPRGARDVGRRRSLGKSSRFTPARAGPRRRARATGPVPEADVLSDSPVDPERARGWLADRWSPVGVPLIATAENAGRPFHQRLEHPVRRVPVELDVDLRPEIVGEIVRNRRAATGMSTVDACLPTASSAIAYESGSCRLAWRILSCSIRPASWRLATADRRTARARRGSAGGGPASGLAHGPVGADRLIPHERAPGR